MVRRSKLIEHSIRNGAKGEQFTKYQEDLRRKSRQRSSNGRKIRLPASNALLKKSGNQWGFDSEKALEDFVYENLNSLLNMTPLQRQYYISGEKSDILALDQNKRLVLLELKNEEYRHIVQQLTRYYAGLCEEKPFQSEVDFSLQLRLIAITPRFHKHSLIDREYSKLDFEFWKFEVIQENNHFYLLLINLDTGQIIKSEMAYQEKYAYKLPENLPAPPKALQNILSQGNSDAKKRLLEIREQLLGFHERIQEITSTGVIKYGRGKTKLCAEINLDTGGALQPIDSEPYSLLKQPFLWLYLPITHMGRPAVGRMRIRTNDWKNIQSIEYIPRGKRSGTICKFDDLLAKTTNQSNQLDLLVDIALETWLSRL